MKRAGMPLGISNFEKIRLNKYYYIDKSLLIKDLLNDENPYEVNLITRPRRFGKTLAMNMLNCFFDINKDSKKLFDGLQISNYKDICNEYMNKYPTVFITFKDVDGLKFKNALYSFKYDISKLFNKFSFILDSDEIDQLDKNKFILLMSGDYEIDDLKESLSLLIRTISIYYKKQVILLLDEYDVPLAKSSINGYYTEMLDLIKNVLSKSFKDNPYLKMAIITGCMQISKESIFTGTNNFVSNTISKGNLNEYFGFTNKEVEGLLEYTGFINQLPIVKKWYDGYNFGGVDIYCPWDVLNYVEDCVHNSYNLKPISYWKNTSDNSIIRSFINYKINTVKEKLELLMHDKYIICHIEENMTYDFENYNEDHFWTILYLTGYLTKCKDELISKEDLKKIKDNNLEALVIPNNEVKEIYQDTIITWFNDSVKNFNIDKLFKAIWNNDIAIATEELNRLLLKTISYHDYKEDFYHAFLAGIFAGGGYIVESNREHGEGRSDIVVVDPENYHTLIFEVKCSKKMDKLEEDCNKALNQIVNRKYSLDFIEKYRKITRFAIAFYKKNCLLKCEVD